MLGGTMPFSSPQCEHSTTPGSKILSPTELIFNFRKLESIYITVACNVVLE